MEYLSDEDLALVAIVRHRQKLRRKTKRKFWVHPLMLLRDTMGEHLKIELMYSKYPDKFFEYTRLSPQQFDHILALVENSIRKEDTNYRAAITPKVRLFVTLRYLATGDALRTIATSYSLGVTTVWKIIHETVKVLWETLAPMYVKPPDKQGWVKIIQDFETAWNFPNCLGAVDGKHVVIEAPGNSGSSYYNYKGTFSIVLMATCDAHYRFTTVDIGAYGRQSDGGIFAHSALGKSLCAGTLDIPSHRKITNSQLDQSCTFLGDEAFPLNINMMRPYPGKFLPDDKRIFNYRLSRGRRVIENSFGILCSRFRIFRSPILAKPDHVKNVVKAAIALHNFLRSEELNMVPSARRYCPTGFTDTNDEANGEWRDGVDSAAFQNIQRLGSNMHARIAKDMRDNLAHYFMTDGQVSWQNERAGINT